MKLEELKKEILQYQYMEDTSIIDVSIASILANRLKLGDAVWLMIIGASSGGKSQILRPLALTDTKFIHRVDDLTENTFLSGAKAKEGEQVSLLLRIGAHGIIVVSDLTVLMSKSNESRATILSQFRMLYDGEMVKYSGTSSQPIRWPETGTGYLGVIAGSTPSIYAHFEEVADMGERFIYYRMKEVSPRKATELALSRSLFGRALDDKLSSLYAEYIKAVGTSVNTSDIQLSKDVTDRIIEVAMLAERIRTTAHKDWRGENIVRLPTPAMPMRVALQLTSIAKGLGAIKLYETGKCTFTEQDLSTIDWLGYSLANEEKRACLNVLAKGHFSHKMNTATIADTVGLETSVIRSVLQNLSAVGVLQRTGDGDSLQWSFVHESDHSIIRRINNMEVYQNIESRATTTDEVEQVTVQGEEEFVKF